jgi:DNA-binding CsgD family transcriptional regulator
LLADDRNTVDLTARELDVLQLIAAEKTGKEVAHQLEISERTVRYHLESINKKLGSMTRVGAVAEAIRLNLIS